MLPEPLLQHPTPETAADESEQEQEVYINEEQGEEEEVQRFDDVKDMVYQHPLKNRKLKVLYQEWHIGKITWYNNVLEEYRVEFNDATDDYINLNDVMELELFC